MNTLKKSFAIQVFLLTYLGLFCAFGQDDTRSQEIIDRMTAQFKSYPGVSLSFSAVETQFQDKSETAYEGKIWIKGNKYKLELLPEYVIYYDGAKIYQYLPEVNEVNVAKPDPDMNDGDFQLMNPQTYFNLSSKSFRSKLVREGSTANGRAVYEIDLYPVQVKTARYSRIRAMVDKTEMRLVHLNVFMKDGTQYAITFSLYDVSPLHDSFFTFNTVEHPNVEVIDLTF